MPNEVGNNLLRLRVNTFVDGKPMSQAILEERTGIDRSYISKIEQGTIKVPGISVLERLAGGLGVPVERLAPAKYYDTVKRTSSEAAIVAMIWADTSLSDALRKRAADCVRGVYAGRKTVDKSA